VRGSEYKGRLLVEKFKRGLNRVIRQKLMESEYSLGALSSSMSRQQI